MSEPEDKDQLWSEATLWFARMRSPDAEQFRPEFEEWLARGALHRRYYNRAGEYWVDSGSALFDGDDQQSDDAAEVSRSSIRRKRGSKITLVAASLVIAGSTVALLIHPHSNPPAPSIAVTQAPLPSAQFATVAGEQRVLRLADGSLVMLGGDTILRVQLTTAARRLLLDRGRARFEVAHEARPFVVFAGGGSVTARGTVFEVGMSADHRVSVRLIRGSVDVSFPTPARASGRPMPRRLHPGETVRFDAAVAQTSDRTTAAPAPSPANLPQDYQDVRLADIVAGVNRHAAVPIRLADPATGELKVSGRFRTDETAPLADRLAALFDLVVDRSDPSVLVLRPK